tara:strand:+ start:284 stop:1276 length:993 start_codon:yes stop_codon:yes gene_type:complete
MNLAFGRGSAMNLNHLRILRSLASTQSMVRTASLLDIRKSTVSQAISTLEDNLGVTLLDRSKRPLKLTRAGVMANQSAIDILNVINDLKNEIGHATESVRGELRIGFIDGLESFVMPAVIDALAGKWPERTLKTRTARSDFLLDDLREERIDIAISGQGMETLDGVENYELISEPLIAVVPSSMIADERSPDCVTLPMIKYNTDFPLGRTIDAQMKRCQLSPRILATVDSTQGLVSLVTSMQAWAVTTPLSILDTPVNLDHISVIPTPFPLTTRTISIWHRTGELKSTVQMIQRTAETAIRIRLGQYEGKLPIDIDHLFPTPMMLPDNTG